MSTDISDSLWENQPAGVKVCFSLAYTEWLIMK